MKMQVPPLQQPVSMMSPGVSLRSRSWRMSMRWSILGSHSMESLVSLLPSMSSCISWLR